MVDQRIELCITEFFAEATVDLLPRALERWRCSAQGAQAFAQRNGAAPGDLKEKIAADLKIAIAGRFKIATCRLRAADVAISGSQPHRLINSPRQRVRV